MATTLATMKKAMNMSNFAWRSSPISDLGSGAQALFHAAALRANRAAPGSARVRGFRLSSEASSAGLQVIIVRHGQSTNNLIQERVEARMRAEGLPADEAASIWMAERVHDPALSNKGEQEGTCLSAVMALPVRVGRRRERQRVLWNATDCRRIAAAAAGRELARYLGQTRGAAALVVPSPMLRAMQVSIPVHLPCQGAFEQPDRVHLRR
jgi:hypothetical protein